MAVLGTLPSGKTKHKIEKQNVANKFTTMHRLPLIQAVLLSPEPSSRNLSSVGQFPSQHFLLQHTNDIIVVHGCAMCQKHPSCGPPTWGGILDKTHHRCWMIKFVYQLCLCIHFKGSIWWNDNLNLHTSEKHNNCNDYPNLTNGIFTNPNHRR